MKAAAATSRRCLSPGWSLPVGLLRSDLVCRLNSAIGAGRHADAVTVAFCLIDDSLSVHQLYCFLRAGFDAFERALAFCRIDDYFHAVILS
jgi:hypothetical protein